MQFLESSHNEIVYKAKKLEYILEKERREARRESLPTSETNKVSRLKAWFTSKVSSQSNFEFGFRFSQVLKKNLIAIEVLDFLGLGQTFWAEIFEGFGVFLDGLSAPILVL